tara:strand:+ start:55421 stop:55546 length:126 start_codon:yes stop_codon:yes gene_type:complete
MIYLQAIIAEPVFTGGEIITFIAAMILITILFAEFQERRKG